MAECGRAERPATGAAPYLLAAGVIIVVVAALYGRSIGYGLILDDFNHRAQLREGDWSFGSLVEAAHLGGPRRRLLMWWQEEADQRFFRPLAFGLMRAQYVIGGWRPAVMHVFSLAWLTAGALLVMALARAALGHALWAGLAGVLFVVHPANALTPRWIACQNEQMATVFILAGLLLYARWSGWQWSRRSVSTRHRAAGFSPRRDSELRTAAAFRPRGSLVTLLAAVACFMAALGCRETGVVLAPLLIAGDWLLRPDWRRGCSTNGTVIRAATVREQALHTRGNRSLTVAARKRAGRWGAYLLLAGVLVAYFAVRHIMLGGFPVPARPYAHPPGEPGFWRFVVDKFAYYVLGLFAGVPIVGFEGLRALRANPAVFYGMAGVIVALWTGLILLFRHRPVLRFWLLLTTVPLVPVLPVFASSHHLYLASAAMVLAGVSVARWAMTWASSRPAGAAPPGADGLALSGSGGLPAAEVKATRSRGTWAGHSGHGGRLVRASVGAIVALHLVVFAGMNAAHDVSLAGFSAAGQLPVDEVMRFGGPIVPDDRLFFINLPMLGWNCVPAIEEATGAVPLTGYVLTFAPSLLRMERAGFIERVGGRQLRVWLEDGSYFSGPIGRRLYEAAGRDRAMAAGERFATADFEVVIADADPAGVRALLFTFRHSLDDPRYHFFLGSPVFSAYPVRFR